MLGSRVDISSVSIHNYSGSSIEHPTTRAISPQVSLHSTPSPPLGSGKASGPSWERPLQTPRRRSIRVEHHQSMCTIKAASVPIHWENKVKEHLDRDVRLGVLEKVLVSTPDTWCHRMVIVGKANGEPR